MKRLLLIFLYLFLIFIPLLSAKDNSDDIKLVRTIGDDSSRDYTLFGVGGAVISKEKDIFIADSKGLFISKYSWEGKFIKRVGKRGQGPKEFGSINGIDIHKGKIYVMDALNLRVAVMDKDLNFLNYIRFQDGGHSLCLIKNGQIMTTAYSADSKEGKIRILSPEGKLLKKFFNYHPFGNQRNVNGLSGVLLSHGIGVPVINYNKDKDKIVVGFIFPKKPSDFYILDREGEIIKKFSHTIEGDYEFPWFIFRKGKKKKGDFISISRISFYKERILVFVNASRFEGPRNVTGKSSKILVFNWKGEFIKRINMPVKETYGFLHLNNQGYLCCCSDGADITRLYIYKLNL